MKQSVRKIGLYITSISLLVMVVGCGRMYQGSYTGGSVVGTVNNQPLTGAAITTTLAVNGNSVTSGSMVISGNGSSLTGVVSGGAINGDSVSGLTVTLQNPTGIGAIGAVGINPYNSYGMGATMPLSSLLMSCPAQIVLQCTINFLNGQNMFNETCTSTSANCSIQFTVNSGTKS